MLLLCHCLRVLCLFLSTISSLGHLRMLSRNCLSTRSMTRNCLSTRSMTDVLARVSGFGPVQTVDSTGRSVRVRSMYLPNENGYIVEVSLWEHFADYFDVAVLYDQSKRLPVVLACAGLQVCDFKVMLLRNIDQLDGLCNGTRLMIVGLSNYHIEAQIMTTVAAGTRVLIPRIVFIHTNINLPFKMRRKQFPVKVSYAMTINKSQQGQSLRVIRVYLLEHVFSHGQFYVAVSRTTSREGLKILISNADGTHVDTTKNIVYREVFSAIGMDLKGGPGTVVEFLHLCPGGPEFESGSLQKSKENAA